MLGSAGGIGHLERAAQRVARRNALEGHQLAGAPLRITGAPHGRKAHGAHGLQAQRLGLVHKGLGRGVVAGHHDIAAQQLQGVALQPALEPVRKKTAPEVSAATASVTATINKRSSPARRSRSKVRHPRRRKDSFIGGKP